MLNKKRFTAIVFIVLNFIFMYGVLFTVVDVIKKDRIDTLLQTHLENLELHYDIILHYQRQFAQSAHDEIVSDPKFIDLYSEIAATIPQKQNIIREKLILHLTKIYEKLKKYGVLQFHFVFTDNVTSLRMHTQNKFGDDLTSVRDDFKYANQHQVPVSGFIQGRSAHGFRNVYPIFDFDGKHLGAFEISFSGESFQNDMTNISKIHTHFLLDKVINGRKMWSLQDTITKYTQSTEHDNYMVSVIKNQKLRQCISSTEGYFDKTQESINKGIENGKKFSLYIQTPYSKIDIVSFLPVRGFNENNNLAWIVSYLESGTIQDILFDSLLIKVVGFFLLVLLSFFIHMYILNQIRSVEDIHHKAYKDGLTGVYNRNQFDEKLKDEFERNSRYNNSFCVALIDIDHFKNFNDTYGHLVGDKVLILLAQTLDKKVRHIDTFCRWGGEEFAILFPETGLEKGKLICEKLRKTVEQLQQDDIEPITISIGVTFHKEGDTIEKMFSRCDEALYEAKKSGRNQVSCK